MVTVPKNSSSEKKRHLMGSREYRMSFGTGGLYAPEARRLLAAYQDLRSWDNVIDQAVGENLLQFKSSASTRRAVREIVTRLKSLSQREIEFYLAADPSDQAVLAWLAVCRTPSGSQHGQDQDQGNATSCT